MLKHYENTYYLFVQQIFWTECLFFFKQHNQNIKIHTKLIYTSMENVNTKGTK